MLYVVKMSFSNGFSPEMSTFLPKMLTFLVEKGISGSVLSTFLVKSQLLTFSSLIVQNVNIFSKNVGF